MTFGVHRFSLATRIIRKYFRMADKFALLEEELLDRQVKLEEAEEEEDWGKDDDDEEDDEDDKEDDKEEEEETTE